MASIILFLIGAAFIIAFTHTLLGPDHYLPFIVLSISRKWDFKKTFLVTLLCGAGHILSSVILGIIGLVFGISLFKLEWIEGLRGEIAVWLLIIFGFTYFIWGIQRLIRNKPHRHSHCHKNGSTHTHLHSHHNKHAHMHYSKKKGLAPWIMFLIFIFGPCEPLIPLLMYPAAESNYIAVVLVILVFGLTTLLTMSSIVIAFYFGLSNSRIIRFERYAHPIAGLTILLCGGAIMFFGV